jgi:hypothetical protein
MADEPANVISLDEFRNAIVGSYAGVREEFAKHFGPGVTNFVLLAYKAYGRIQTMEERVPYTDRSAWTYQFLYVALNDLVCAFHLQISGFIVPAGNLMRQFAEAVAMGLLCSHESIDVFERVQREGTKFPAHHAVGMVKKTRNRQLLNVDAGGWAKLEEISQFYDSLSHAGVHGASAVQIFGVRGAKALGGAFDPAKLDFYQREMSLSHSAAMRLIEAVIQCENNLKGQKGARAAERDAT